MSVTLQIHMSQPCKRDVPRPEVCKHLVSRSIFLDLSAHEIAVSIVGPLVVSNLVATGEPARTRSWPRSITLPARCTHPNYHPFPPRSLSDRKLPPHNICIAPTMIAIKLVYLRLSKQRSWLACYLESG